MTTPDVRAQAADLIDQAIDVLHQRGWCQGALEDAHGRVCIEGALGYASEQRGDGLRGEMQAWLALLAAADETPADFNDEIATSIEDCVLVMKQAAASLREPQP